MVFSTRSYISAVLYQKCDSKKNRGKRCHILKPLISDGLGTWKFETGSVISHYIFITWYDFLNFHVIPLVGLGQFVRNGLLTISWQFNWPFSGGERLISFWQTGLSAAVPNAAPPPLAPPNPSPTDDTELAPEETNIGPARCWKFIKPPASSA